MKERIIVGCWPLNSLRVVKVMFLQGHIFMKRVLEVWGWRLMRCYRPLVNILYRCLRWMLLIVLILIRLRKVALLLGRSIEGLLVSFTCYGLKVTIHCLIELQLLLDDISWFKGRFKLLSNCVSGSMRVACSHQRCWGSLIECVSSCWIICGKSVCTRVAVRSTSTLNGSNLNQSMLLSNLALFHVVEQLLFTFFLFPHVLQPTIFYLFI